MASLRDMGLVLTIFILGINSMALFMTTMPSNTNTTEYYDFGFNENDLTNYSSDLNGFETDSNTLVGSLQDYIVAKQSESTSLSIVESILLGGAEIVGFVAGGVTSVVSLVSAVFKYLVGSVFFGYFSWLDYFFDPVCQAEFGSGFCFIKNALKGCFFLIQVITLVSFLLPIFVGGRTS